MSIMMIKVGQIMFSKKKFWQKERLHRVLLRGSNLASPFRGHFDFD